MPGFVNRRFVGGVANRRVISIPASMTKYSVPREDIEYTFWPNERSPKKPLLPDEYVLRKITSPSGLVFHLMVLSTITDEQLEDELNGQPYDTDGLSEWIQ